MQYLYDLDTVLYDIIEDSGIRRGRGRVTRINAFAVVRYASRLGHFVPGFLILLVEIHDIGG